VCLELLCCCASAAADPARQPHHHASAVMSAQSASAAAAAGVEWLDEVGYSANVAQRADVLKIAVQVGRQSARTHHSGDPLSVIL